MRFLLNRKNRVRESTDAYLDKILETMDRFKATVELYFAEGISRRFLEMIEETHILESHADDMRRRIEIEMYEKSLIPESRGDILGLLEAVDNIPNKAQSVLYQVETEQLEIPAALRDDFLSLIENNIQAMRAAVTGFRHLFHDLHRIRDSVSEVDKRESSSDRMERDLIRKIFQADYELGRKILLKELVIEIGNISDLSEDVTDRLNIVSSKRLV